MDSSGAQSTEDSVGIAEECSEWTRLQAAIVEGKTAASSLARAKGALSRGGDPRSANAEGLTAIGAAMGRWSMQELGDVFGASDDDLCMSFGYPGSRGEKGMPTLLAATIALGDPGGWGAVQSGEGLAHADERLARIIERAGSSPRFADLKIINAGARAAAKAGAPESMGAYGKIALALGRPIAAADLVEGLSKPFAWSQRLEGYLMCLERAKESGVDLDGNVGASVHGVPRSATLLSLALTRAEGWERSINARDGARAIAEKLVELGVDVESVLRFREGEYLAGRAKSKSWPAWERWTALIEARLIQSELGSVEPRAPKKRL